MLPSYYNLKQKDIIVNEYIVNCIKREICIDLYGCITFLISIYRIFTTSNIVKKILERRFAILPLVESIDTWLGHETHAKHIFALNYEKQIHYKIILRSFCAVIEFEKAQKFP